MAPHRRWLVLTVWAVGMALGCNGCEERGQDGPPNISGQKDPGMVGVEVPMKPEFLRLDHRLMELGGAVDFENRYQATVMVLAVFSGEAVQRCSGAAISRHVVLTAGHCVCRRRQEEPRGTGTPAVIDSSACVESVGVETVLYKPPVEAGTQSSGSTGRSYQGEAHPHPELRVTLDKQGRVLSSQADLALIVLSKPLDFPGFTLSEGDVEVGDSVTVVGHEYDEVVDVFGGERRSSVNQISRRTTAEDARFLIEQPQGHRYRQDSGGPCLRSEAKRPTLVGVASRWLGEGAACLSIQGYQGWLRENIRRTEEKDSIRL